MLQIRQDRQLRQRMPLTSSPCATSWHFLICREQMQRAPSLIKSTLYKWEFLELFDLFLIDPDTRRIYQPKLYLSSKLSYCGKPNWYMPRPLNSHTLPSHFKYQATTEQMPKAYGTPYSVLVDQNFTPFIGLLNGEHVKC
jgi:hypothetical protein